MTRTRLFMIAASLAACIAMVFTVWPKQARLEITYAQLQTAIDSQLAVSNERGFLPRVRFNDIQLSFDDGAYIAANGNWFSVGAGAFTRPDVSVRAHLPDQAQDWEVRNGRVTPKSIVVEHAFREPFDTTPGRPERTANIRGWERKLIAFFEDVTLPAPKKRSGRDWQVVAVHMLPHGLVFELSTQR